MAVETSIVIRTKNEERWIGSVLQKLMAQSYKNFEIIIIDSGSTDKTIEIAKRFPIKLFKIPTKDFSYPYALNYGIKRSSAIRYICIMSAHSLPVSNRWLEDGLENFHRFERIVGVYAHPKALPDGTFWDKVFHNGARFIQNLKNPERRWLVTKRAMGVLGFTNSLIRKDLWEQRPLNELYGAGGEDEEWARYWLKRGYRAVYDKKFAVYHSHYLGLLGWIRQYLYWRSVGGPSSFKSLEFRKDSTHNL